MFVFIFIIMTVAKKIKMLDVSPTNPLVIKFPYTLVKNIITDELIVYIEYNMIYVVVIIFILHFSNIKVREIISIIIKKKDIGVANAKLYINKLQSMARINILIKILVLRCLLCVWVLFKSKYTHVFGKMELVQKVPKM